MGKDNTRPDSNDEFTEIWSEIKSLRASLESVKQELSSLRQVFSELSYRPLDSYITEPFNPPSMAKQYDSYAQFVSTIDVVRKVLLTEGEDVSTIWTIIDDSPLPDSSHKPVYDEQVQTLEILKYNLPLLSIEILNVSKAARTRKLRQPDVKILWERH